MQTHNLKPLPKLELDKKRFRVKSCPCGRSNKDGKFVPYTGYENKGYCHSCGETFLPELIKSEQWNTSPPKAYSNRRTIAPNQKQVSFIPVEVFKDSLKNHETNHFVKYLIELFGIEVTNELISKYFIGTSNHWPGATVFWQIDIIGKIRTGKIMLYNTDTGKRVKEPFNHIQWVHKLIDYPEFELKQCFFGSHLLHNKTKPVAIVESEKTAIIASVYLPQFIWLSVGGVDGLNTEKCSVLKGRNVTLFPDLNRFENWSTKAKELLVNVSVSDLLERKATEAERKQGLDLADYLIKFDYKDFALAETLTQHNFKNFQKLSTLEPAPTETFLKPLNELLTYVNIEGSLPLHPAIEKTTVKRRENADKTSVKPPHNPIIKESPKPENWEQDITELENYFESIAIPPGPLMLNQCGIIINIPLFIESHIATLKANNGKLTFAPFLSRLQTLKTILQNEKH